MKLLCALITAALMLPVSASGRVAAATEDASDAPADTNVIATVGDQKITFGELNIAMNSSALVGVSIPALGTPERDTARITLLDRFVSANLLYLDALKQGTDKQADYQRTFSRFSTAILAGLYRRQAQAGDIPVTDDEIKTFAEKHLAAGTELSDDLKVQIESKVRRQKLHNRMATAEKGLRVGVDVAVHPENLDIAGDQDRADDAVLAQLGSESITWGQVSDRIISAGKGAVTADPNADEAKARSDALEREIDLRIMAQKARAIGLDNDPLYKRRIGEFSKTLLTNMHRKRIVDESIQPTDEQIDVYYAENRARFVVPESRRVQMVVVKTRQEADDLKAKIDEGKLTMYQAARDFSIAAKAKQDLGEVGWVNRGETVPALDKVIFDLGPGVVSAPVETPAGWHLVTVQDTRDAKFTDIGDPTTRKLVKRRYLHDQIDAYTAKLRQEQFPVVVYQDRLVELAQREADMVKEMAARSHAPGSVTQKRIEEMQKMMKP